MTSRSVLAGLSLLLLACGLAFAADVFDSPQVAQADPAFQLQGEYAGPDVGLQVIALGGDEFRTVTYRGGLPGAGWDGKDRQAIDGDRDDALDLIDSLGLKKVERKSPTLGAEPPAGAVVLFDGSAESLAKHWKPGARRTDDGLLMEGCTSTDQFQDFTLHLEFRTPFMPAARGQGRGNSGVYYQGRYETQVLDSFGLTGENNECGGLYSIKAPDLNMCLPPLSWQTYDVDFTAARYENGQKVANPLVTVRLNGVVVHSNVELPHTTTAAPVKEGPEPGPIYLQNHGNPVRYRNIWVLPRDPEKEARRPIVPAFERFHARAGGDPIEGGRLLVGELNCTSCHAADGLVASRINPKQAPILDQVGRRVKAEYLFKYINDPHTTKPGSTMPHVLEGLPPAERTEAARAITNFLVSTGTPPELAGNRKFAANGEKLFHSVGCVACHMPRNGQSAPVATSVPLVGIEEKYTIPSLTEFLKNPHAVRPSGRMPSLNLNNDEARDLANYLLGDVVLKPLNPNMKFAVYEGSWDNVPDYSSMKPVKTGESAGLDLNVAGRSNNFGMRFEGFLKIEKPGKYRFFLGSDDGSLLFVNEKLIIENNGVHPHTVKAGEIELPSGVHPLRVDYAQVGGEWTLGLDYEGPNTPRQKIDGAIYLTPEAKRPEQAAEQAADVFVFDASQIDRGRELFTTVGCASCHQLKENGKPLVSQLTSKPLGGLDLAAGCLAEVPPAKAPNYDLTAPQRNAIAAALAGPAPAVEPTTAEKMVHTMTTFNCYACHSRDGLGGPERERDALFLTTIPEMGDEGRVPPPLNGVGDKLREDWIGRVLNGAEKVRPYMLTRMPNFAGNNVGHLVECFAELDQKTAAEIPTLDEPPHRIKATGRLLVGDKGLSCIKCHTFGNYRATGVQALDLQTMTSRIREDWFHRYLPNPPAYRPGTRMPSGFPNGTSTVTDVYEGDPGHQIAAMWTYLKDGGQASIPEGLLTNAIVLQPEEEPIIYRNFIQGLSPRGIAVGYPERAHLAWDAEEFCLTTIWHGRFIDASRHWNGRGQGFQGPLGDHVLTLEKQVPVAVLDSAEASWPSSPSRERGYRFLGYKVDDQGRPIFRYGTDTFTVEDYPQPVTTEGESYFRRTFTVSAEKPVENLYLLAAAGSKIEKTDDGAYRLDDKITIRLPGQSATIRKSGNRTELLVPVKVTNGTAQVIQEIVW